MCRSSLTPPEQNLDDLVCVCRYTHSRIADTVPRAYHATVALDEAIYMIGGFDGSQYYKSVKKFNAVKQTWQEVSPMYHQVSVKTIFLYEEGKACGQNWCLN